MLHDAFKGGGIDKVVRVKILHAYGGRHVGRLGAKLDHDSFKHGGGRVNSHIVRVSYNRIESSKEGVHGQMANNEGQHQGAREFDDVLEFGVGGGLDNDYRPFCLVSLVQVHQILTMFVVDAMFRVTRTGSTGRYGSISAPVIDSRPRRFKGF